MCLVKILRFLYQECLLSVFTRASRVLLVPSCLFAQLAMPLIVLGPAPLSLKGTRKGHFLKSIIDKKPGRAQRVQDSPTAPAVSPPCSRDRHESYCTDTLACLGYSWWFYPHEGSGSQEVHLAAFSDPASLALFPHRLWEVTQYGRAQDEPVLVQLYPVCRCLI